MMDLGAVGTAIGVVSAGIISIAGGVWAGWNKQKRVAADTRADVAESGAARTIADAQQKVYQMMVDRLTALEKEMISVREELAKERNHSRVLTMRIWELEGLMHKAGITIPPFSDPNAQDRAAIITA